MTKQDLPILIGALNTGMEFIRSMVFRPIYKDKHETDEQPVGKFSDSPNPHAAKNMKMSLRGAKRQSNLRTKFRTAPGMTFPEQTR